MSLKFGKREIDLVIDVLDQDHETLTDAATAALDVMEGIFERRALFVVVGQLYESAESGQIDPSKPEAIKVSLGWYSTEGDAMKAAESLTSNAQTGDRFRTWVLPVFHGTPAELHAKQKEKYAEAEAKRAEKAAQTFQDSIRKHREAMEERAGGGKGSCETCGHQPYDHSMTSEGGKGRGKCWQADCQCTKWKERLKAA